MRNDLPNFKLDQIDYTLLDLLQKDGRTSNAKLAKSLNMSETPCWRRFKRLEEAGFIRGYRANLNRQLMGFGVLAFVKICFSIHTDESLIQFEQAIKNIPEVLFAITYRGKRIIYFRLCQRIWSLMKSCRVRLLEDFLA